MQYEKNGVDSATAMLTGVLTQTPVPNAKTEVIDTSSGLAVATGTTDSQGQFTIQVPAAFQSSNLVVRVWCQDNVDWADLEIGNINAPSAVYTLDSTAFTGPQAGITILATADNPSGRIAGAFNIYSTIMKGMEFIRAADPAATFPDLDVGWELGAADPPPCNCALYFNPGGGIVYAILLRDTPTDTTDFDDSVILHEFGHYVQMVFSRTSSPGGSHFTCGSVPTQDLDYRLSFSEGWGNAFAQIVLNDPVYVNTSNTGGFTFQLETPCLTVSGPGAEDAIGGVFWDLVDGTLSGISSTDGDTLNIGFGSLWQAFKNLQSESDIYIADLLIELILNGAITIAEWDANFTASGLQTPLPAFPPFFLTPNDPPIAQIVNASLDQESLFQASQYYAVTVATAGTLTITVTITDSVTNNLDLFLWEDPDPALPPGIGTTIATSESPTLAVESISVPVAAGTYMIQVRARDHVPNPAPPPPTLPIPAGDPAAAFTIEVTFS